MRKRPNILFIMADDHACRAISAYGSGLNPTPAIDRIAAEGMRLNHCYVTNSICTPSRATILTGTHNHVNRVQTLRTYLDNRLPNVAKELQAGGYATAIVGKWHLGEGQAHEPTGFDYWSVLPGQGSYFDPQLIEMGQRSTRPGYVTDVITDISLAWLKNRDPDTPFFLMCHHKAPHRSWEPHPKYNHLYQENVEVPVTFNDDYKNRARAAAKAKMRVRDDLTYEDLGLVPLEFGEPTGRGMRARKVPNPENPSSLKLTDADTGEVFCFSDREALGQFKYQRYIKRYLRTIASLDENVGRILEWLDSSGLAEDTIVIYTSDQGFFLGEHGWFDKRFIYEQSFQMPFLIRYPSKVAAGTVCDDIVCNVDFAPTLLDFAGLSVPEYMQGRSFRMLLEGQLVPDWPQLAYHRYWMHRDATHNVYAHYGVRDQRYKLIYWYNEGFNLPGTREGGQDREWEFFDLKADPCELFNLINDPSYRDPILDLYEKLNNLQREIGDRPEHSEPPS